MFENLRPQSLDQRVEMNFPSRAYLHHLDRRGEMLGTMHATGHNLHDYLNLMREVREAREALDAGRFGEFRAQFKAERSRGV